jgi:CHAD domain-containing protein
VPAQRAPEYIPPAAFDPADVARRLPAPLTLGEPAIERGERAFYDTFDRRLRNKGLSLVHEEGALRLHDAGGRELAGAALGDAPDRLDPHDLPTGVLRDAVVPVCDIRVLLRSAQVRSERRRTPVLDDEGKTVARLISEQAVLAGGGSLRPRLYCLGVRGYEKELDRVRHVLEGMDLTAATESIEDEAVVRSGTAAGVPPGADVELTPDLPADRAAVALCMGQLHSIEANLPGTLADLDTEFLHDFRVAIRRTRSLQRELKKVFPPAELKRFRQEFRWLQQVTGPSRDLDVYLLEFDDFARTVPDVQRRDLEVLRSVLEDRRASERVDMENALRSARTTTLLGDWAEFLERLPSSPVDDRPYAVTPIGEVAARRIYRVYKQMVGMGKQIDDTSPHHALHDLRKKGKELRYLLEFFTPLFPGKVTKPMVKTLKALQDTLGRFQDREVQAAMVRDLGPLVVARDGGSQALMAMGILIERLGEQQHDARAEFAERFAAFAAPDQRELVKRTFK